MNGSNLSLLLLRDLPDDQSSTDSLNIRFHDTDRTTPVHMDYHYSGTMAFDYWTPVT